MKLIIATIETRNAEHVIAALPRSEVNSIIGSDIKFTSPPPVGRGSLWEGEEIPLKWVSKTELKIVVQDDAADVVIENINRAVNIQRTDKIGDGEIFMLSD